MLTFQTNFTLRQVISFLPDSSILKCAINFLLFCHDFSCLNDRLTGKVQVMRESFLFTFKNENLPACSKGSSKSYTCHW